jgi:hypothetical protein
MGPSHLNYIIVRSTSDDAEKGDVPVVPPPSFGMPFKMRLQRLVHLLKTKMGTIVYITTSNEFQKRGYPHSHIIIKVRCNSSCVVHMLTRNSADRFIRNFL